MNNGFLFFFNQSILRACGKQKLLSYLGIVAFWVLGTPLGALLAFYFGMKVIGVWIGFIVGLSSEVCSFLDMDA